MKKKNVSACLIRLLKAMFVNVNKPFFQYKKIKIEHRTNDLVHSVQKVILYVNFSDIQEKPERKTRRLATAKRYDSMKRL